MSNIEKLYYNMERLSDDWEDMPKSKKASDKLIETMGEELYAEHETEICDCMCAREKQGFILGFQYAVSLLTTSRKDGVLA